MCIENSSCLFLNIDRNVFIYIYIYIYIYSNMSIIDATQRYNYVVNNIVHVG